MDVVVRKSEVEGVVTPPPSKSYTHRVFLAASLSKKCRIYNPLIAEDTLATLHACKLLGSRFVRRFRIFEFWGCSLKKTKAKYFYLANSGTTLRFLIGLTSQIYDRKYSVLDGDTSLRNRPNRELVLALKSLGARIRGDESSKPPLFVRGVAGGGEVKIKAISSQFISSLLFTLPNATGDSTIFVEGMKSKPYVDITLHVLRKAKVRVEVDGNNYYIQGEQDFKLRKFEVPSDFSSASYLIAAGLLAGKLKIKNMFDSMQGDKQIIEIAKQMGGKIKWDKEEGIITVEKSELKGIDIDASNIPDLVPAISVMASVAKGKTRIHNAEHLKLKEIDRIDGIYQNLKAVGVEVKKMDDGLIIKGGKIKGGVVNSFGDHRMALAFSLLGLVAEREVMVKNAEVVSVSFPNYYETIIEIGGVVEKL
ncbi:3-phosphoshikimate 1-carboxyvinyltransferase [Archaeoglobales archaeon]|nr:MAG: 3-phosphoshikimate 1-carboxyvinyltransferase [Archaeoglobales archaeon]